MTLIGITLLTMTQVLLVGIGITLNSYITRFSFTNLKDGPNLHPTNLIYFIMGLVNIFLQCVLSAQNMMYVFWPCLFYRKELSLTLSVVTQSAAYCSFWLTGWLCAHYCVTITSFGHQLIIGLKRFLSCFLPHVLVLSIIGPSLLGVLSIWMVDIVFEVKPSINCTGRWHGSHSSFHLNAAYRVMSTFLGCCLPFAQALVSTSLTISSLIRHMDKMKHNVSGHTRSSLRVLINATRTMILFLALSVLFYVFQLLFSATTTSTSAEVLPVLSSFIIMSCPLLEAITIVQASPKLREKIWGVLGKQLAGLDGLAGHLPNVRRWGEVQ